MTMSSQKDEMAKDGDDVLMMVARSDEWMSWILHVSLPSRLSLSRLQLMVLSENVDGLRDSKDVLAMHCARCVTNNKY